jgi:hypothetical protein
MVVLKCKNFCGKIFKQPLLYKYFCSVIAKDSDSASNDILNVGSFAKIDLGRDHRAGFPEVVFASGKSSIHFSEIMKSMFEKIENTSVIATRVSLEQFQMAEALIGPNNIKFKSDCQIAYTIPKSNLPTPICKGFPSHYPLNSNKITSKSPQNKQTNK